LNVLTAAGGNPGIDFGGSHLDVGVVDQPEVDDHQSLLFLNLLDADVGDEAAGGKMIALRFIETAPYEEDDDQHGDGEANPESLTHL